MCVCVSVSVFVGRFCVSLGIVSVCSSQKSSDNCTSWTDASTTRVNLGDSDFEHVAIIDSWEGTNCPAALACVYL